MDIKEIGLRIKEAREDCKITRKELADKISVAASTVSRYESGLIESPKVPVLESIARALEVNPMWIIGKSNFKQTEQMIQDWNKNSDVSLSIREKKLVKKYRALPDPVKDEIDGYVDYKYESQKAKVEKDMAT